MIHRLQPSSPPDCVIVRRGEPGLTALDNPGNMHLSERFISPVLCSHAGGKVFLVGCIPAPLRGQAAFCVLHSVAFGGSCG